MGVMWLWMMMVGVAAVPPGPVARPTLSGPEQIVDIDGFRLHYTTEGIDAVPEGSYLDELQRGLLEGMAIFEEEGWLPPLPDDGTGGSNAIDVYVVDVARNGSANALPTGDGDASCFIRMDPGIPNAGGTIASVARHELHHCIQFRYRTDLPSWLYESGATYEQYRHAGDDPLLELAVGVLWDSRLRRPEARLGDDADVYATFLWSKFWAEYQSYDPTRLVDLWEALREDPWPVAMERAALDAFGESLDEVFLQHAVYNRFACADDDGQHYLDDPVPCRAPESRVPSEPFEGTVRVRHDQRRFTAAYFDVAPATQAGPLGIRCVGADGLRIALVTVDEAGRRVDTAIVDPVFDTVWVDRKVGEGARLIVAGTDAALDATCAEVAAATPPPGGCATATPFQALGWCSLGGLLAVGRRRSHRSRGSKRGAP